MDDATKLEVLDYLDRYYLKYPSEQEGDRSTTEILEYNGETYIDEFLFIQYKEFEHGHLIQCYWCDGEGMDLSTVKKGLKNHKKFIKSLGGNVYAGGLKGLFQRKLVGNYDEELKLWRMK